MFSRSRILLKRVITARSKQFSGHGHNHENSGPYAAKHHVSGDYGNIAYPLGVKPGTPLEGWEIFSVLCFFSCIGAAIYVNYTETEDDLKVIIIIITIYIYNSNI